MTSPRRRAKRPAREGLVEEILALAVGVGAAVAFPIIAIIIHRRRERRHNRRMGVRRTDKIKL